MDIREFFRNRLCFSAIIYQYSRGFFLDRLTKFAIFPKLRIFAILKPRSFFKIHGFSDIVWNIRDFFCDRLLKFADLFSQSFTNFFFLRLCAETPTLILWSCAKFAIFPAIICRYSRFYSMIVCRNLLFFFSRSFLEFRDFILRSFDEIYDFFPPPIWRKSRFISVLVRLDSQFFLLDLLAKPRYFSVIVWRSSRFYSAIVWNFFPRQTTKILNFCEIAKKYRICLLSWHLKFFPIWFAKIRHFFPLRLFAEIHDFFRDSVPKFAIFLEIVCKNMWVSVYSVSQLFHD